MNALPDVWVVLDCDGAPDCVEQSKEDAQQEAEMFDLCQESFYPHSVLRYVLPPDEQTLAALRLLHDSFGHTLTPEQRAAVRGWLGRVA